MIFCQVAAARSIRTVAPCSFHTWSRQHRMRPPSHRRRTSGLCGGLRVPKGTRKASSAKRGLCAQAVFAALAIDRRRKGVPKNVLLARARLPATARSVEIVRLRSWAQMYREGPCSHARVRVSASPSYSMLAIRRRNLHDPPHWRETGRSHDYGVQIREARRFCRDTSERRCSRGCWFVWPRQLLRCKTQIYR